MYMILNKQKINIKIANNINEKIKGLMGHKIIEYGLLIPNCNMIHTYFMRQKIDILVLDNNTLLYRYQNIDKNKILIFNEDIKKTSILELPKNTSYGLKIGDILTFEYEQII